MSIRPRRSTLGSARAATTPTVPETPLETLTVAESGLVVGSVCTAATAGWTLVSLAALGGGRIAWVADPDPHVAPILAARLPGIPNLGDLRAIDWRQVEPIDVLTAGFPCQDISAAGKRAGIEKGRRSGLWTDIVGCLRVLRPTLVVVENVAALRWKGGGLHRVLGDLAEAGYDALWRSVRAADIGAAHRRERVFLLGWLRTRARRGGVGDAADADRARRLVQRHLGGESTGQSLSIGPATAATYPHRRGREELHPQDPNRWSVAARRGQAAANTEGVGHRHGGPTRGGGLSTTALPTGTPSGGPRDVPAGAAADAASDRRGEGLPGATRLQRGPDAALSDHAPARSRHRQRHLVAVSEPTAESAGVEVDWGVYTPAVRRWERVLGRPAPFPTQPGRHGRPVLAPAFVEWLQGLEPGWVTALPLPRTAQLHALGNGVVPQQAAHAVALLLADLTALLEEADTDRRVGECRGHRQERDAA